MVSFDRLLAGVARGVGGMFSVGKYLRRTIVGLQLAYLFLVARSAYAVRYLPPPRLIPQQLVTPGASTLYHGRKFRGAV